MQLDKLIIYVYVVHITLYLLNIFRNYLIYLHFHCSHNGDYP